MSEDKSNIIPINQAMLNKLSRALKTLNSHCYQTQNIDAMFITFEGFMRTEHINWDGRLYWEIPKYARTKFSATSVDLGMSSTYEKMIFALDTLKTTKNLAVFRQVE